MVRNGPYYSKKQLRKLISEGNVFVTGKALNSASESFGWSIDDICAALLLLPAKSCYKSEQRFDNPKIWVDYYRAKKIKNEDIYTHFYVDGDRLIIDSFKELKK